MNCQNLLGIFIVIAIIIFYKKKSNNERFSGIGGPGKEEQIAQQAEAAAKAQEEAKYKAEIAANALAAANSANEAKLAVESQTKTSADTIAKVQALANSAAQSQAKAEAALQSALKAQAEAEKQSQLAIQAVLKADTSAQTATNQAKISETYAKNSSSLYDKMSSTATAFKNDIENMIKAANQPCPVCQQCSSYSRESCLEFEPIAINLEMSDGAFIITPNYNIGLPKAGNAVQLIRKSDNKVWEIAKTTKTFNKFVLQNDGNLCAYGDNTGYCSMGKLGTNKEGRIIPYNNDGLLVLGNSYLDVNSAYALQDSKWVIETGYQPPNMW